MFYMFSIAHTQSCYILSLLKVHYVLYVFYSTYSIMLHIELTKGPLCFICSKVHVIFYMFYSTYSIMLHIELTKGPLCFICFLYTQSCYTYSMFSCYILSLLKVHYVLYVFYSTYSIMLHIELTKGPLCFICFL